MFTSFGFGVNRIPKCWILVRTFMMVNRVKGCSKENSQLECQDKKDVEL